MQSRAMRPVEWAALLVIVCTGFASQMVMPLWVAAVIEKPGLSEEVESRIAD